jgi:hypothetical protein
MAGKKKSPKAGEPVRLCIDYADKDALLAFVSRWNLSALTQDEICVAFKLDSLDTQRINASKTYILKRKGDRPKSMELK